MVLPIDSRTKSDLFVAVVHVDRLVVDVATPKNTGLEVLVFSLL